MSGRPGLLIPWPSFHAPTRMLTMMKAIAMRPKRLRAECPNQLMAPTTIRSPKARTKCNGASSGRYATMLAAPEETLMEMVSTKSTMSAPTGTNAQASPKACPVSAAPPPPSGKQARDELSIVGDDDGNDEYDEAHRRQNEGEVAVELPECGFDGIGGRRDRIGHDCKGEGDQQYGPTAKNGEEPRP